MVKIKPKSQDFFYRKSLRPTTPTPVDKHLLACSAPWYRRRIKVGKWWFFDGIWDTNSKCWELRAMSVIKKRVVRL